SVCMEQTVTVTQNLFVAGNIVHGGTFALGAVSSCGVCPSDQRLKDGIKPLDLTTAEETISSLQPAAFAWHNPQEHPELGSEPVGFIAQELPRSLKHWLRTQLPRGKDAQLIPVGENAQGILVTPDMVAYLIAQINALHERHALLLKELATPNAEQ